MERGLRLVIIGGYTNIGIQIAISKGSGKRFRYIAKAQVRRRGGQRFPQACQARCRDAMVKSEESHSWQPFLKCQ